MYENIGQGDALGLGNVGDFAFNYYWSSTEYDGTIALLQGFGPGSQGGDDKTNTFYVRAIRAF